MDADNRAGLALAAPTQNRLVPQEAPHSNQPARCETYFHQDCPACGRKLQVLLEHLGQLVACRHCDSRFIATDPASGLQDGLSTLARADQLLACCSNDSGRLRARVRHFLQMHGIHDLEAVDIEIDRGVVVLQGRMASSHSRWLFQNCIQRVAGVLRVVDQLDDEPCERVPPTVSVTKASTGNGRV